jgi:hypothetical protein
VALAAGITATLTAWIGWRGAFLVPAVVCVATGIAYFVMVPDDRNQAPAAAPRPTCGSRCGHDRRVRAVRADRHDGGLVFNTVTIALPKVIDERIGAAFRWSRSAASPRSCSSCGAVAQFTVGRLLEKYPPHLVFAFTWSDAVHRRGLGRLCHRLRAAGALAFAMAFIYAQVTVNDFVIARYTADAWRARVYAVRYFITYLISGAAITMIAFLHSRGGFDLVLGTIAVIAFGFVIGTAAVALLVNGVERDSRVAQPAE